MSVCDYCNFHKYGECQKLEDLLEEVEDDYEASLIADQLYRKCEDDYYDWELMQGDIRDDR